MKWKKEKNRALGSENRGSLRLAKWEGVKREQHRFREVKNRTEKKEGEWKLKQNFERDEKSERVWIGVGGCHSMPWPPGALLLPTFLSKGESLSIPYFGIRPARHLPVKCKHVTHVCICPKAQVQGRQLCNIHWEKVRDYWSGSTCRRTCDILLHHWSA